LTKAKIMSKNTSISLGSHFEQFIQGRISDGRYSHVSEVIRAALRLLEEEESKVVALRRAIEEGMESGIAKDFDPQKHLTVLMSNRRRNA